jgi:hypothetical protein
LDALPPCNVGYVCVPAEYSEVISELYLAPPGTLKQADAEKANKIGAKVLLFGSDAFGAPPKFVDTVEVGATVVFYEKRCSGWRCNYTWAIGQRPGGLYADKGVIIEANSLDALRRAEAAIRVRATEHTFVPLSRFVNAIEGEQPW